METLIEGGMKWETNKNQELRQTSTVDRLENSKSVYQKIVAIGFSATRRLGLSLQIIFQRLSNVQVVAKALAQLNRQHQKLREMGAKMIGPIEKGLAAAEVAKAPEGSFDGVDLRVLPKYICFKAALLHNKMTLQYLMLILSGIFVIHYVLARHEIYSLYGKLREKEYILAPGVMDFTPASPQAVPDSYVASAVTDFLGQLGNVTAGNIDEQYGLLSESMSPQLKVKFLAEAASWKNKVKTEGISELFTVTEKEIRTTGDGYYKVTALARRDTYINNEYLGRADEAIEMVLELIPPKSGKRWYLQINQLSRESANSFQAKKRL